MTTGTPSTVAIILRGASGSGKSTTAAALRQHYGRGLAIIGQDVVRRSIVWEKDLPGAVNVSLIDVMARRLLDQGVHVVIEGILYADNYGDMLTSLIADHVGRSFAYLWDLPFEATVDRHLTKPNCDEWTVEQMRSWFRPNDLLPGAVDRIISPDASQEQTVQRILAETGLLDADRPAYPSLPAEDSPGRRIRAHAQRSE